ncbi:MAG TPA: glutamate-cysteine ligase family protein, partial [Devosia sp.]|nr:glutamate-cysteine ligase family protein [Devosia sp.]
NSPFVDGKPSGDLSFRARIWLDTDRARTGLLPFVFDDGFGFDRYVEHALDVPMYFVIRDHRYIDASGQSFRAFLRGELPQLPGEKPTIKDWEDHLSTLFPEVRLKQFLEMRGADMGDRDHVLALPALWVGLLYDSAALDAAWSLVRDWTAGERDALRDGVPRTAIHTPFRRGTVADVARQMVDIARSGLEARGQGEEQYLAPLEQTLALGKTPAERWLDKYHGEWGGDLTRIFDEAEI